MKNTVTLKEQIAKIIAGANEGAITPEDVLNAQSQLSRLGMSSLTQLRVVDAIENRFGVPLDLERDDLTYLDSLDGIAGFLRERGIEAVA